MICAARLFTEQETAKKTWGSKSTKGLLTPAKIPAKHEFPTKWPLKSTEGFLTKWTAPTRPSFQTAFWDCYMIVILCVNHLFYCSYNMARCRQAPYKMASEMGLEPLQISTYKIAGLLKVISYKMTLEIGLIWAWRPAISQGKFQWRYISW